MTYLSGVIPYHAVLVYKLLQQSDS